MYKSISDFSLDERKIEIVKSLFISTADNDYLTARWNYQNAMSSQFFWAAAQAIEKYMKAALLLNDISVKNIGHDLGKLFILVNEIDISASIPNVTNWPYTGRFNEENWQKRPMEEFIDHLSYYGSSHSRYGMYGTNLMGFEIHILDQLVFSFRAFMRCQNVFGDDLLELGSNASFVSAPTGSQEVWTLCYRLPLERLFNYTFQVGQTEGLRKVFSNMNLSFFEDQDEDATIFGGQIFKGSPLMNHLIHQKKYHNTNSFSSSENLKNIKLLKQWAYSNIPISNELKQIIDDPKYKHGIP